MTFINDNATIEITCPKCKAKFKKTIRELKGAVVKCSKCGLGFETSQFTKGLNKVDELSS